MVPTTGTPSDKLDYGLARLMGEASVDESARIPVVIRVADDGSVDVVQGALADLSGEVRHVFRRLRAVSAWVRLGSVRSLADLDYVSLLELVQTDVVARA